MYLQVGCDAIGDELNQEEREMSEQMPTIRRDHTLAEREDRHTHGDRHTCLMAALLANSTVTSRTYNIEDGSLDGLVKTANEAEPAAASTRRRVLHEVSNGAAAVRARTIRSAIRDRPYLAGMLRRPSGEPRPDVTLGRIEARSQTQNGLQDEGGDQYARYCLEAI